MSTTLDDLTQHEDNLRAALAFLLESKDLTVPVKLTDDLARITRVMEELMEEKEEYRERLAFGGVHMESE